MALAPSDAGLSEVDNAIRLVAAHRSGEPDAFEQIARMHYGTLLAYAQHQLGNVHDAQDAVQDTYVRALKGLDRFGSTGDWQLGAWLQAILTNVCRDAAGRRRPTVSLDEMTDRANFDFQVDIAEITPDPVALGAVLRAIAALPEARRHAFLLRMVDDLSYCEVAGQMGISEDSTRALVSRARRDLRKALRGVGAISGSLAMAPLFLTSSVRASLRRIFSTASDSATVGATSTLAPTASTLPAASSAAVGNGVQMLGQLAATPLAQVAIVSSTVSAGRGSVILGIVASLATAGGLSGAALASPIASADRAVTVATVTPLLSPRGAVPQTTSAAGRIEAPAASATVSGAAVQGTSASTVQPPAPPAATDQVPPTPWVAVAASAPVQTADSAKSANAATSPQTSLSQGATASTGAAPGSSGSGGSTPTGTTPSGSLAASATGSAALLPPGTCSTVTGFAGVRAPGSVPALSATALSAVLTTGVAHLTAGTATPSFVGTAIMKPTGSQTSLVAVKVGTCLAETGSLLAVEVTGSTGDAVQAVGSLVSEPVAAATGAVAGVTYLFRGTVIQTAGVVAPGGALPWGIPPDFVAELQIAQPGATATLTVVFLAPTVPSGVSGSPTTSGSTTASTTTASTTTASTTTASTTTPTAPAANSSTASSTTSATS